jgi:hypothetical protein
LPEEPAEGIGKGADGDTLKNPPGFRAAFFEEKPESELDIPQEHHEGFFPHEFGPVEGSGDASDGDGFLSEGGAALLQFFNRAGSIFSAQDHKDIGTLEDLFSFRRLSFPEGMDEPSQVTGSFPKNPEPPLRKLQSEMSDGVGLPLRSFSRDTRGNADGEHKEKQWGLPAHWTSFPSFSRCLEYCRKKSGKCPQALAAISPFGTFKGRVLAKSPRLWLIVRADLQTRSRPLLSFPLFRLYGKIPHRTDNHGALSCGFLKGLAGCCGFLILQKSRMQTLLCAGYSLKGKTPLGKERTRSILSGTQKPTVQSPWVNTSNAWPGRVLLRKRTAPLLPPRKER